MKKPRRHKVYDIEELCALQDDGKHWLVRDMVPKIGRTMVWGDGGTFKTSILIDLAVAVASGGALLRQFTVDDHGPVFIVSAEGSIYSNRDRILAHLRARETYSPEFEQRLQKGKTQLLPNKEDLPIYYCQKAYLLDEPEDREEFTDTIEEIKPKLIIIDPLDSFFEGEENSASETKRFRRYFDEVIEKHQCSVMIIHHSTKDSEKPSIRGSSAWRGWIDASLRFAKREIEVGNQKLQYVEVEAQKQRDGAEGKLFTALPEFDKVRNMTTYTLVDTTVDPDILTKSLVQQQVLTTLQHHGALTQKDISEMLGYTWKRVQLALQSLEKDGYVAQDALIKRPTSSDGSRYRSVPAWRALGKISLIDVSAALLRAKRALEEQQIFAAEEYLSFGLPTPNGAENAGAPFYLGLPPPTGTKPS